MLKVPTDHPGDEALLALSLGYLADVELAHISSHLGECPVCCCRIDQLNSDDRLVARLRRGAAVLEDELVTSDERRSAVRALNKSSRQRAAAQERRPARGAISWIANASAQHGYLDASSLDGELDEHISFLAPPEQPDEIGRLGAYRILAVLGKGGMGIVFRAHDPLLDRLVAIKAMLPRIAAVPTARDRFLREGRAAAAFKHPHIVTVFQVGEERGVPFLAMEFLEGEQLDDRIRREGQFPLADVLSIGRQTALGLAAAHARGLVHRDIKPANLWLEGSTGHVKILDFGLAHATADEAHLTQLGIIVGTPAYMAPEQAEGKHVDPRSDLFSLGCVLYQVSTGTLPYQGDTTIAVLRALALHEPPVVSELRGDAPPELSALVARLLAKKPEDRPASAQEVANTLHALEQLPATRLLPKPKTSPPRKGRKPRIAVAGGVLAVVLALMVILWPTPRGTVRIESDDPAVKVTFDKDGPTINGADKDPITLRAGEHGMRIQRGDFSFEADKLVLTKGAALTLNVELLEGKLQVLQDGKAVATQVIPLPRPPLARAPFSAQQARDYQKAWAEFLGVPVVFANRMGMKFRLIPPGEFTMGATEAEAKAWNTLHRDGTTSGNRAVPPHPVRLSRPFYLAEREVRYREFLDLVKREPGDQPKHKHNEPDGLLMSQCTWFDCIEFCNRLSEQEELSPAYAVAEHSVTLIPGADGYRLPTEAEWEFACRAGTTTLWNFGMTAQEAQVMVLRNLQEAQLFLRQRTSLPNPFGLLGMYAGASEWCWDWYSPGYYKECADRGLVVDPRGPDSGEWRIDRGGSSFNTAGGNLTTINSAARNTRDPMVPFGDAGFGRVVLPILAKVRAGSAIRVLNPPRAQ